jgi:hypothetical protein
MREPVCGLFNGHVLSAHTNLDPDMRCRRKSRQYRPCSARLQQNFASVSSSRYEPAFPYYGPNEAAIGPTSAALPPPKCSPLN